MDLNVDIFQKHKMRNLQLDDNKHKSFQLSICSDQALNENATHASEKDVIWQDLGQYNLQV